jgi:hypothetical protein
MANFVELLKNIYSPRPELREHSVETYKTMAMQQPNELIMLLVETIANEPEVDVRRVAILMLRRAVRQHDDSLWPHLTEETKMATKQALLFGLHNETVDLIRTMLNDTVAELACHIAAGGGWPELLDDLFSLSSSEEMLQRQSGLLIFGQILNGLQELLEEHIEQLRDILVQGMNDNSLAVRLAGLSATRGFIIPARKMETKALLQPLVPPMLAVLEAARQAKHPPTIGSCLEIFIDWAIDPLFFAANMEATLTILFEICDNQNSPGQQQMAAEFLVTLAARQPSYMAKVPRYVSSMVDCLLRRLMEVDNMSIQEWNETAEDDLAEITISNQVEEYLDQFCLALHGKVIIPHIMPLLVQMINNAQDWRARYAGLMAVSLIAEGCKSALRSQLADLVALVLPRMEDEHPRVRWASLNAIGQLTHDFAPQFQANFHADVMPRVIAMFGDAENPKVQAIAATCIVSYSENKQAPPESLIPYMDVILSNLNTLMGSTSRFVLEEAVTCIGAIAANSKEHFTPYYDIFVPTMRDILHNTHDQSWYNLRSKTIDTFSLIGDAVGKDKFATDAHDFMMALQDTHLGEFGRDDSMRENMLFAAARICKILGQDFVPFLPMVLPSLLETANMQDDIYLDVGEDTENGDTERDGWQYTIIGNRKFGIHNTALDEKNVAVRVIYCFVDNLADGLINYIPSIVSTIEPLTKFTFHKGIRSASASTLPLILNAVREHGYKTGDMAMFQQYFAQFFNTLMEAIADEEFSNVLPVMLDSVSELIEMVPSNTLATEVASSILQTHQTILTDMRADVAERAATVEKGEYTPEEEDEWKELDQFQVEICTELANLYGVLVRYHPQVVLPIFEHAVDFVLGLLPEENNTKSMRQVGLCWFADSVEHMRDAMQPLLVQILPYMIHGAQDEGPGVRQAASYGLGACAEHGGAEMVPWLEESLNILVAAIEVEGSRDEEAFQAPTENAICAVGKFILFQPLSEEQLADLIPHWLNWLPLYNDQLEARVCHGILMTLIENNNQHIWGENYQNLPKILDVISWCLTPDGLLFINPDVHTRMRTAIRTMHQSAPDLLQSGVEMLQPAQQEVLAEVLNSDA